MIPIVDALNSYDLAGLAVALGITLLVAARIRYGEHLFTSETRWWGPLRRVVLPVAHSALESLDPKGETGVYLTYEIGSEELVATIEVDHQVILDDLADAGYQPQPLAALKTDWEGRREVASWARFHGPTPFEAAAAPDWLRARQTHVTLFTDEATTVTGETVPLTIVTAHDEYSPWRPDQWRDHYLGIGMDVERGVFQVADDLGVDANLDRPRSAHGQRARSFR